MYFALWITDRTNTHSEYVLLTFTRQKWLHERAQTSHLYVHCLSWLYIGSPALYAVCTDLTLPSSFLTQVFSPKTMCVQNLVLPCLLHGRLAWLQSAKWYAHIQTSVTYTVLEVLSQARKCLKLGEGKVSCLTFVYLQTRDT